MPRLLASGVAPGQSEPPGNPRLTLVSDGNPLRRLLLRSKNNIGVDGRVRFWMDFARHIPRGKLLLQSWLIAVCPTIITLRRVKLLRPNAVRRKPLRCLSSPTGPSSQSPNTLNLTASGCIPTNGLCPTQTLWRLISNSDKSVSKITAVTASGAEKLELELDRL